MENHRNREEFKEDQEFRQEIKKDIGNMTKKVIEKNVFERFGSWLNKLSKCDFK